jgi:DNA invertase Pin-like site-specific DNA recombinase
MGKRLTPRRVAANAAHEQNVMRVAIYVRVSTEDQAEDDKTSLDDQEARCRASAESRGWIVIEVYREAGFTGTKDSRPEFNRMMRDAKAGKFDVIMAIKIKRLVRKSWILGKLMDELEPYGVAVKVLEADFDTTTPMGVAMLGMAGVMAQLDRDDTIDTLSKGAHAAAAKNNIWPCSKAPYPYRHKVPGKDATLVQHEIQARIMRDCYQWIVLDSDHLTVGQCIARLNAAGRFNTQGKPWSDSNLRHKLTSTNFLGFFYWGKTTGRGEASGKYGEPKKVTAQPVLKRAEFDALQKALSNTARNTRSSTDRVYPLSGRITCLCGGKHTGTWRRADGQRNTIQYRCQRTKWNSKTRAVYCNTPRIKAEPLERLVWSIVQAKLGTPKQLQALFEQYIDEVKISADNTSVADSIGAQIAKLERALTRAQKDRLMAEDTAGLDAAVAELQGDLRAAQAELDTIESARRANADHAASVASLAELAAAVGPGLADATPAEQADIMGVMDVQVKVLEPDRDRPCIEVSAMFDVAELMKVDGIASRTGGVAPLGHPKPVRTLVDTALEQYDEIWAAGGVPQTVFPTTYAELVRITAATPAEVA